MYASVYFARADEAVGRWRCLGGTVWLCAFFRSVKAYGLSAACCGFVTLVSGVLHF